MPTTNTVRSLLSTCLCLAGLLASSSTLAADSYITRPPTTGDHFRKATAEETAATGRGCSYYIAAYSNIYLFESGSIPLAINLNIRNTNASRPVYVQRIDYFAADGSLIESVLVESWRLAPMATATYVIDQHDMRGGAGANFIVEWAADKSANAPLIEAVMAGYRGSKGLSFSSRGVALNDCSED